MIDALLSGGSKNKMWKLERDDFDKLIDILPIGENHEYGQDCWCHPRVELNNGWLIFIHNSLDGREYLVEGKLKDIIN